jgi:hypothetical protein
MTTTAETATSERADVLAALAHHRRLLRFTVRDLTDDQAGRPMTVSSLCLGGLIKHVAEVEAGWARFIVEGPTAMASEHVDLESGDWKAENWLANFQLQPGETLAGVLEHYAEVAAGTDELVATLPSLASAHPLPEAPWFEPGAAWSARRVVLHIIGETAQHAGHADIIRESLDGAKSMG